MPETPGFNPTSLIEEHQAGVWRYLRALGCEASQAEDLTQEVFIAVLQRPFQDYNSAATAAYLRRTAYNMFISDQRRNGRMITVEELEVVDTRWAELAGSDNGDVLLESLRDCLHGLSDRARRALELLFQERQTRASIADALEISEHGVKNLMQRAKKQLRECIENKMASGNE
ncbi:MAG: RNA polymerase sigma-70 factor (ECF subfamily) [Pirellulaceae bacterium]|jgi:RNA polymerase sigma-70 factor (ECF subfamily)